MSAPLDEGDELFNDLASACSSLKAASSVVRVVVLGPAGDTEASAKRIAEATGITNVAAGLSPEEKLHAIKGAREQACSPSARFPGVIMVRPPTHPFNSGIK